jgi:hypothetical protein
MDSTTPELKLLRLKSLNYKPRLFLHILDPGKWKSSSYLLELNFWAYGHPSTA